MAAAAVVVDAEAKYKRIIHGAPMMREFLGTMCVRLTARVAAISPGAHVYMKGGGAYAFLMKNARENVHIPNIPEELTSIASDWDLSISIENAEQYRLLKQNAPLQRMISDIFAEVIAAPEFAPLIADITARLQREGKMPNNRHSPNRDPEGWRGTNEQGFYYFGNPAYGDFNFDLYGFGFAVKRIDDTLAGLDRDENRDVRLDELDAIRNSVPGRPWIAKWTKVPLIDVTLIHPSAQERPARGQPWPQPYPNPEFLQEHHLIPYTVPTWTGPGVIHLIGYDEMWLDLMKMLWEEGPMPNKLETRQNRFSNLLRLIFCTPSLMMLTTPIGNYKLLLQLVEKTQDAWEPISGRATIHPMARICHNPNLVLGDGAALTETLEVITTACREDVARLFGRVLVDLIYNHTTEGSQANIPYAGIERGFNMLSGPEKCDFLKRMYVAQLSWYANSQFHWYVVCAMGIYLNERVTNPALPITRLDDLVECAIKSHDFFHYRTLTLNSQQILYTLDGVCEDQNRQAGAGGRNWNIVIEGGYGFAHHLAQYMGTHQIFTADMDIGFIPTQAASEQYFRQSQFRGRLANEDGVMSALAAPDGALGMAVNDRWDSFGRRWVVQYGYISGQREFLNTGIVVDGQVLQHTVEIFLLATPLTQDVIDATFVRDQRFRHVHFATPARLIAIFQELLLKELEPYKRKKYRLRVAILRQIEARASRAEIQANLDQLLDTDRCDAATQAIKAALLTDRALPVLTPGRRGPRAPRGPPPRTAPLGALAHAAAPAAAPGREPRVWLLPNMGEDEVGPENILDIEARRRALDFWRPAAPRDVRAAFPARPDPNRPTLQLGRNPRGVAGPPIPGQPLNPAQLDMLRANRYLTRTEKREIEEEDRQLRLAPARARAYEAAEARKAEAAAAAAAAAAEAAKRGHNDAVRAEAVRIAALAPGEERNAAWARQKAAADQSWNVFYKANTDRIIEELRTTYETALEEATRTREKFNKLVLRVGLRRLTAEETDWWNELHAIATAAATKADKAASRLKAGVTEADITRIRDLWSKQNPALSKVVQDADSRYGAELMAANAPQREAEKERRRVQEAEKEARLEARWQEARAAEKEAWLAGQEALEKVRVERAWARAAGPAALAEWERTRAAEVRAAQIAEQEEEERVSRLTYDEKEADRDQKRRAAAARWAAREAATAAAAAAAAEQKRVAAAAKAERQRVARLTPEEAAAEAEQKRVAAAAEAERRAATVAEVRRVQQQIADEAAAAAEQKRVAEVTAEQDRRGQRAAMWAAHNAEVEREKQRLADEIAAQPRPGLDELAAVREEIRKGLLRERLEQLQAPGAIPLDTPRNALPQPKRKGWLWGGRRATRFSLPTRRAGRSSSSRRRRYTHRQQASRTGKGDYRSTKKDRKV